MQPPAVTRIPRGSFVLIYFPYTDLSSTKLRPALVLYEGHMDVTIAAVSSQVPTDPMPTDILILHGTSSFVKSGLKLDSVLLMDKIATLEKSLVKGILGEADDGLKREVNTRISQCLMFHDISDT